MPDPWPLYFFPHHSFTKLTSQLVNSFSKDQFMKQQNSDISIPVIYCIQISSFLLNFLIAMLLVNTKRSFKVIKRMFKKKER